MATMQETIRGLNAVKTNGQARSAVGAASKYVAAAYPKISDLPYLSGLREPAKRDLDRARVALEAVYPLIPSNGLNNQIDPRLWAEARDAIVKAYIAGEGLIGAATHEPQTTFAEIVSTSIVEAPGVFAKGVGRAAAAVGDTAGSVVGGVFSGLGVVWTVVLLLVAAGLVFVRLKGMGIV